jgi:exocyst complex component 3
MEFTLAEAESIDLAKKAVAEMLTKPEDLEKLEQYRRKVARKKATVESQLRNAVQTQLEGVQTGLENLGEAQKVISEIKISMAEVEDVFHEKGAELSEVVRPIKEVNRRHQQLKTTSDHIHNIFNVPQAVSETHELIKEGKLLEAHRNLSELEHTRDELLMQLYHGDDAYVDKNTSLHHYYEELIGLSGNLGQSLWMIMNSATLLVTENPTKVVTALRIIEREERIDTMLVETLDLKGIPPSQIPGRPKKWRSKCIEMLETSISNKFESLETTSEQRIENKDWLMEHLSEVARTCYMDLQAITTAGVQCFPPSYDIAAFFIKRYHRGLIEVICQLIDMGLNARDIITLMIWIGDIKTSFAETLGVDLQSVGPLMKTDVETDLLKTCHGQVESNVRELMGNMVKTEQEEWNSQQPPECDVKGRYYTPVGINLFQIIDQNIQALAPLGLPTKMKVLKICLGALDEFQRKYRNALDGYYRDAAGGRIEPPCCVLYIIAIANSCRSCVEFTEQLKKRMCMELNESTLDKEFETGFKSVAEEFDKIGLHCCDILVDVLFTDLKKVLSGLMTRDAWFSQPMVLVGTVEGTILDFNGDFSKLKPA